MVIGFRIDSGLSASLRSGYSSLTSCLDYDNDNDNDNDNGAKGMTKQTSLRCS
jgi:hypothetical protein